MNEPTEPVKKLAQAIDKAGAKVTFGLQPREFSIINKHLSKFDGAKYSNQVWKDIGKEIGWEPLTAALYYFRHVDEDGGDGNG